MGLGCLTGIVCAVSEGGICAGIARDLLVTFQIDRHRQGSLRAQMANTVCVVCRQCSTAVD
jgi:hypothetical protein